MFRASSMAVLCVIGFSVMGATVLGCGSDRPLVVPAPVPFRVLATEIVGPRLDSVRLDLIAPRNTQISFPSDWRCQNGDAGNAMATAGAMDQGFRVFCECGRVPFGVPQHFDITLIDQARTAVATTVPVAFTRNGALRISSGMFTRLTCVGFTCSGSISTDPVTLFVDAPAGTLVTFGTQTATSSGETVRIEGDLLPTALTATVADLYGPEPHYYAYPVALQFAGGERLAQGVNVSSLVHLRPMLNERFTEQLPRGPSLFPGEVAGDGAQPHRSLVTQDGQLLGHAERLTDVDLVALRRRTIQRRSCGMYRRAEGNETAAFSTVRIDYDDKVYERRTGRRVAQQHFNGSMPDCPASIATVSAGEQEGLPPTAQVAAWLQGLITS